MASMGHCASLNSPSKLNFALSIVILLGILLSYVTQHYRIIARKSSEGISPYFVLLGVTSGTCGLSNILVLPASRADLACCSEISGFACFAGVLGILQVALQWSCFGIILLLFLLFFPKATSLLPGRDPVAQPSYRTALVVAGICIVHGFLTTILNVVFLRRFPDQLQSYANVLGLLAAGLASIQYFPQIYTTWRLKHVGSLSIPMMCIQTPGSFVWAGSLAARVGWEGWSTWGVYVVTGILQGCVLSLGIYYELKSWRLAKERNMQDDGVIDNGAIDQRDGSEGRVHEENSETTPLLADARSP